MPKLTKRELDEAWSAYDLDDEDMALLSHVLDDDRPPQGLHRHGFKDSAICDRHGPFYAGEAKCPTCKAEVDDEIFWDWKYPLDSEDEI